MPSNQDIMIQLFSVSVNTIFCSSKIPHTRKEKKPQHNDQMFCQCTEALPFFSMITPPQKNKTHQSSVVAVNMT